ncbi:hypothetical protein DAPPUDRAFT_265900 [Daphnia pulex]|uniref:Uncharacterized protein n=1 Tax=Daphnia pulex TaxID=6669 RepID=E9HU68_DAPPU|nr:hypothetical protein DAPPUDRAFT_265900 [Daphnia pulex]|eukprot:EFX64713.1 hypothetical protein DAPPUDRAFT_265900 [Daphnia pulex]
MTQKPIRLSALGRDVKVGDLYNYNTDFFLQKNTVELLDENIDTASIFKDSSFYLKPDDRFKRRRLGINSHLDHNIKNGNVNATNLWFNAYLEKSSTKEDDKNVVTIDFFFRLKRCTKRINEKHLRNSKLYDYQSFSGGRVTHLVEEVVYGAECICSMRRDLDQSETKENAVRSLHMAAKAYIHEAINPNLISLKEQPKEFTNVICTNYCSLSDKIIKTQCSIRESCEWLREAVGFDKDFAGGKWQAVEIVLRYIPDQIGAQVLFEMKNDFNLEKEQIRAQMFDLSESKALEPIANEEFAQVFLLKMDYVH